MLLMVHLAFALSSLVLMTGALIGAWFRRDSSYDKWTSLSGLSFGGLLVTGVALVIKYHTSLASACLSGIFYLTGLTVLYALYKRLAQPPNY